MANLELFKWIKDYPKNLELFRQFEQSKKMENQQASNPELIQWVKNHPRELKPYREFKSSERKSNKR